MKKCYVSTVTNKQSCLEVQCVEATNAIILEDVGLPVEQRSTEELVRMLITEDGSQYFLIGRFLTDIKRAEMFDFLLRNIEVFA